VSSWTHNIQEINIYRMKDTSIWVFRGAELVTSLTGILWPLPWSHSLLETPAGVEAPCRDHAESHPCWVLLRKQWFSFKPEQPVIWCSVSSNNPIQHRKLRAGRAQPRQILVYQTASVYSDSRERKSESKFIWAWTFLFFLNQKSSRRAGGMAEVVEHLSIKC
jgi:hypothetical protein